MEGLVDPKVIEMFWKEDLNPVLKKAAYLVVLQNACDESPWKFYGEDIGFGGKIGFSVHRLKNIADKVRLPFKKSTAYKVYKDLVKLGYVKATRIQKKLREYTFYSITKKGREASQETLDTLHTIPRIEEKYNQQFKADTMGFIARPDEWDTCWKRIGEIWEVPISEEFLSEIFTQATIFKSIN